MYIYIYIYKYIHTHTLPLKCDNITSVTSQLTIIGSNLEYLGIPEFPVYRSSSTVATAQPAKGLKQEQELALALATTLG